MTTHKRLRRFLSIGALGVCVQLVGCQSNEVWEVISTGVRGIAVDVSEIFFEALIDRALELDSGA